MLKFQLIDLNFKLLKARDLKEMASANWSLFPYGRRFTVVNENGGMKEGFFSAATVFSSHKLCEIVYDNKKFGSSEHLYFYLRADKFSDAKMAEKFRQCANGKRSRTWQS